MDKVVYRARTKDEFGRLEKAMDLFLENYAIYCEGRIMIQNVGSSIEVVNISSQKPGKINEVRMMSESTHGRLVSSTPEQVILEINNNRYVVVYGSGQ